MTISTREEAREFVANMIANLGDVAPREVVLASIKADMSERAKRSGFSWEQSGDAADRNLEATLVLSVLDEF